MLFDTCMIKINFKTNIILLLVQILYIIINYHIELVLEQCALVCPCTVIIQQVLHHHQRLIQQTHCRDSMEVLNLPLLLQCKGNCVMTPQTYFILFYFLWPHHGASVSFCHWLHYCHSRTAFLLQSKPVHSVDSDFESLVLRRLRQAQERKKLIEKIKEEDD
jgi:hypothetical protein